MVDIAFVNSATASSSVAVTSLAVNVPAGVVNGNLILTILENNATVTVTPPSGWTRLPQFPITSGANHMDGFYRIAASEPASYTWSFGSSGCLIGSLAYTNTDPFFPVRDGGAAAVTSPSSPSPSVITSDTDWNVTGYCDRDTTAGSTWTTPGGMTNRVNLLMTGSTQGSLSLDDTNSRPGAGFNHYTATSSVNTGTSIAFALSIGVPLVVPSTVVGQAVRRASVY